MYRKKDSLEIARTESFDLVCTLADSFLNRSHSSVMDIACGDGELLKRIKVTHPNLVYYGVDRNPEILVKAESNCPTRMHFTCSDMFDTEYFWPEDNFSLTIIMLGHLISPWKEKRAKLVQSIHNHSRKVICYAYGDYLLNKAIFSLTLDMGFNMPTEWKLDNSLVGKNSSAILLEAI